MRSKGEERLLHKHFVCSSHKMCVIICGDFNDLRLHFSSVSDSFVTQVVSFTTRAMNTLDNIYTNSPYLFDNPIQLSDHYAV
jgi:hypothetical protein